MMYTESYNLSLHQWPELIDAARNGCRLSFSEIINRLHGYLLVVASRQSHNRLQAKFSACDIVQNSVLEAYVNIHEFRGSTEAEMRSWLKSIVVHNLIDETRRYSHAKARSVAREQSLGSVSDILNTRSTSDLIKLSQRNDESQRLNRAIENLPSQYQFVVKARYRHGRDYRQIASEMNISEAAARKIRSRAIRRLRALLNR